MKYAALALILTAGPALAHPGAHVHPHDGAHWLTLVSALALVAVAAGLAVTRNRWRK
ncbi:MAG: hypothetical protein ACSHXH_10820 [Marivita sp.]|uniref:hypothetical protein n=1 Tax=Marivita sp. TaxID=2003365 RepID=UPI003EF5CB21